MTEAPSLYAFLQEAWPVLEPATPFAPNWHIQLICEHLEQVAAGQTRRLIINVPPRSLKSLTVSVCWPAWCWIARPALRWMFASYSASLATHHSLLRRTLLASDWYRARWGDTVQLRRDQNRKTEFANTAAGLMFATSVGGSAMGKGGEVLVLDDPMNPQEAWSDRERETANRWVRQSFLTRLNDPKTGAIVLVMQRLHEEDTTGLLLATGAWTHLCLPAAADAPECHVFPVSGHCVERQPGDLLFPAREGPAELARRRVELGAYAYAGQYQQQPAPVAGGIFARAWWRFWYPRDAPPPPPVTVTDGEGRRVACPQRPLPAALDETLLSWDMAFKGGERHDYVVGQCWGRAGAEKFLLDQVRERADFPATLKLVLALAARHPDAGAILVEDAANGAAVLQVLRRDVAGLIPVTPEGGKAARAHAVAAGIEAGNVYLPHPAACPWTDAFIDRAAAFPAAAHDDEVDAMTQALLRLQRRDFRAADAPDAPPDPDADARAWADLLQRLGPPSPAPPRRPSAGW